MPLYNEIVRWPKDTGKAKEVQERLRKRVVIVPLRKDTRTVAGVDAAFTVDMVIAVASLFSYPSLRRLEDAHAVMKIRFPYVTGYLSFREGEAIIGAVRKLRTVTDLLLVDGQGIAHPRGIGLASHIGVLLDIPTIGCAKSRLVGEHDEPAIQKGAWTVLSYQGQTVGAVLRTRAGVKPLFISPGHLADTRTSIDVVMRCVTAFRIPEPLRRADQLSKKMKKEASGV